MTYRYGMVLTCSRDSQSPHWPPSYFVTFWLLIAACLLLPYYVTVTMRQAQLALSNEAARRLANHTSLSYAH